MTQEFFHLCLLIIIYTSSNHQYVLGSNNDNTGENQIINNNMNFLICVAIFISTLLSFLMIYYYHKYYNYSSLSSSVTLLKEKSLSIFEPIKPVRILCIHRKQAQFILDELINETKRTTTFTIVTNVRPEHVDYMFICVELIQETQTVIALIEYSRITDQNSIYFLILRQFFTILFQPTKTIQTWGNIIKYMRPYVGYGLFSLNEIAHSHTHNIQKEFKLWYNRTFRHNIQCQRYLKYDDMDGSLCSCAHRPYKTSSDQWSITRALAYTFEEQFSYHLHGVHRCSAITKLAYVIDQKWTVEQVNNYKENCHNHQ